MSKCSSGHVECSFVEPAEKVLISFFSARLPIRCYFSHSSNFLLQFLEISPDFFSGVATRSIHVVYNICGVTTWLGRPQAVGSHPSTNLFVYTFRLLYSSSVFLKNEQTRFICQILKKI